MPLQIPFSYKNLSASPVDYYSYFRDASNEALFRPYTSTTEVLETVSLTERYLGQIFFVDALGAIETYQFKTNTSTLELLSVIEATDINFTPTTNIVSTNTQTALEEVSNLYTRVLTFDKHINISNKLSNFIGNYELSLDFDDVNVFFPIVDFQFEVKKNSDSEYIVADDFQDLIDWANGSNNLNSLNVNLVSPSSTDAWSLIIIPKFRNTHEGSGEVTLKIKKL